MNANWKKAEDEMPEEEGMYFTFWDDGTKETYPLHNNYGKAFKFEPINMTKVTHWDYMPDDPA